MARAGPLERMKSGAKRRKIALPCEDQSVWHKAVARALQDQPQLDLVSVSGTREDCLERLKREQPDWVVILSETSCIQYWPSLPEVFEGVPGAGAILLCQCDNQVRIYRSQQMAMASFQDLVDVVKGTKEP